MFKPFPDLVLKEIEGFHIEEMVLVEPLALEPALSFKEQGYRIYTIHTHKFWLRIFRSFIGSNHRKVNWPPLLDLLIPLTRAKSYTDENDALKSALRTAWDDLLEPEQGVALWLVDRLLLWIHEHPKEPASFPRITRGFLEELIRSGESLLKDSKVPHLSLHLTGQEDPSYIPGDAAMAFSGEVETFKRVRRALSSWRMARFGKPLDFRGLDKYFLHVPVWLILGLGTSEDIQAVSSWMENRRKRVQTTQIFKEEDGRTHFLVIGWN